LEKWLLGYVLISSVIGALFSAGVIYAFLLPRIHQIDESISELETALETNRDRLTNIEDRLSLFEENLESLSSESSLGEIPNPAAVFCIKCGGRYEIRTKLDGSQYGICIINGKEYDAWEYYKKHYDGGK